MSNRKQARLEAKQFIETLSVQPYPNSTKVYVEALEPIFVSQCVRYLLRTA